MANKHEFDGSGLLFFAAFSVLLVAIWQTTLFSAYSLEQLVYKETLSQLTAQVVLAVPRKHTADQRDIVLGFVGDIMLDRGVKNAIQNYGSGDYRFPFVKTRDELRAYDILFGNLEGPISDKGKDQGSSYSFRMHPDAVEGLRDAGFDVLSVANNHIGDWGRGAFDDTLEWLRGSNIVPVGAGLDTQEAYQSRVISKNGVRVAYLAFSEFGTGFSETDEGALGISVIGDGEKLIESISDAKNNADLVVVSFHFGDEYQSEPNEFQQRIAKRVIDAGADVVVGHHPHAIQPLERYNNGYIAYSLGNFVFDQSFSEETMTGAVLEITISNKKIKSARYRTVRLNDYFQPAFVD